jgi:hypothetical protein
MALSQYEEQVVAELEAQLSDEDLSWETDPDGPAPRRTRSGVGLLAPPIACILGGMTLLAAARQGWFTDRISWLSGFSAPSIALAFAALGCVMVVGAPLLLRGVASTFPSGTPERTGAGGHQVEAPR